MKVDKGFVAQVADVLGGRSAPMNELQRMEAGKTVVGEFSDVKHVRGILSMGRWSDFLHWAFVIEVVVLQFKLNEKLRTEFKGNFKMASLKKRNYNKFSPALSNLLL